MKLLSTQGKDDINGQVLLKISTIDLYILIDQICLDFVEETPVPEKIFYFVGSPCTVWVSKNYDRSNGAGIGIGVLCNCDN